MKLLHINSYYIDNHLYSSLYAKLDGNIGQQVYIPIKYNRSPENKIDLPSTSMVFDKIIKPTRHKINYFGKIKRITNSIVEKGLHVNVDIIHAHNLFNDGGVAYSLKKRFGIRYIVAVRLTDVALQYRFMLHRRKFARKILEGAESIIFVSPKYKENLFSYFSPPFLNKIKNKTLIVPNGIDEFWFQNATTQKSKTLRKSVNLLFVGQICDNKNLVNLISAIVDLNKTSKTKYTLTVVGDKSQREIAYFDNFLELVSEHDWIFFKGKIKEKENLLKIYREADIFVMPSKRELFGLVYIEALTQGLPVIYTEGEGIGGFLGNKNVGIGVDAKSSDSIARGIQKIATSFSNFHGFLEVAKPLDWNIIVQTYLDLYAEHE